MLGSYSTTNSLYPGGCFIDSEMNVVSVTLGILCARNYRYVIRKI